MFRVGQRVMKVRWREGVPYMKFGTVTKATKKTYYVDNSKSVSVNWEVNADKAFENEYRSIFFDWDFLMGYKKRPSDWTVEDSVDCVCRLRRLERRLRKKTRQKTNGVR